MTIDPRLLSTLQATAAEVMTMDDQGFAEASRVVYEGASRTPTVIVRPRDAAQLAKVLPALAEARSPVAVRGGGHSMARHSLIGGGAVIDMRAMKRLTIDAAARRASAEAGLSAGEYTFAAAEHGLATGFGDSPTVGIAGLTLGGGIGHLSRRFGLSIDQLRAAEMVTADGRIVQADADTNPELFFALRGGGGGFGVVTRLDFDLHDVSLVTGGMLAFRAQPGTVLAMLAAAAEAPVELSLMINVMQAPPAPFLPEALHGKPIVVVIACHSGTPAEAEAALAPFRTADTPLIDTLALQPYQAMFAEPLDHTGLVPVTRSFYFDGWTEAQATAAIEAVAASEAAVTVVNLRPMGGAIAEVPVDATAFGHRRRAVMASINALSPRSDDIAEREAWADGLRSVLGDADAAGYLNFATRASEDDIRRSYAGQTWARLRAVKDEYDPGNLFAANFSVPPNRPAGSD